MGVRHDGMDWKDIQISMLIDEGMLLNRIGDSLKDAIIRAAEPLVQESMRMIESKMRAEVSEMVVTKISRGFEASIVDDSIVVRLNLDEGSV